MSTRRINPRGLAVVMAIAGPSESISWAGSPRVGWSAGSGARRSAREGVEFVFQAFLEETGFGSAGQVAFVFRVGDQVVQLGSISYRFDEQVVFGNDRVHVQITIGLNFFPRKVLRFHLREDRGARLWAAQVPMTGEAGARERVFDPGHEEADEAVGKVAE